MSRSALAHHPAAVPHRNMQRPSPATLTTRSPVSSAGPAAALHGRAWQCRVQVGRAEQSCRRPPARQQPPGATTEQAGSTLGMLRAGYTQALPAARSTATHRASSNSGTCEKRGRPACCCSCCACCWASSEVDSEAKPTGRPRRAATLSSSKCDEPVGVERGGTAARQIDVAGRRGMKGSAAEWAAGGGKGSCAHLPHPCSYL